jgi:hypothetical protein
MIRQTASRKKNCHTPPTLLIITDFRLSVNHSCILAGPSRNLQSPDCGHSEHSEESLHPLRNHPPPNPILRCTQDDPSSCMPLRFATTPYSDSTCVTVSRNRDFHWFPSKKHGAIHLLATQRLMVRPRGPPAVSSIIKALKKLQKLPPCSRFPLTQGHPRAVALHGFRPAAINELHVNWNHRPLSAQEWR